MHRGGPPPPPPPPPPLPPPPPSSRFPVPPPSVPFSALSAGVGSTFRGLDSGSYGHSSAGPAHTAYLLAPGSYSHPISLHYPHGQRRPAEMGEEAGDMTSSMNDVDPSETLIVPSLAQPSSSVDVESKNSSSESSSNVPPIDFKSGPWLLRSNFCRRCFEDFDILEQIGKGAYGMVFKAVEKKTGKSVALKKIVVDNETEGFPITAIREIKILRKLRHNNVVNLLEIVSSRPSSTNKNRGSIYLVFEYMDHDLCGLMEYCNSFSLAQIKLYIKQLLEGVFHCHKNDILHRDLKASNLLINNEGTLKIGDFGLARPSKDDQAKTNRVVTLWYRAPELLLGAVRYGESVDMWSVGCICAELLCRGRPLIPGKSELDQLNRIFSLCGTPSEASWPGVRELPEWESLRPPKPSPPKLREHFLKYRLPEDAIDFLCRFFIFNPTQRMTAHEALDHDFLWNDPLPADVGTIPLYESINEFKLKMKNGHRGDGDDSQAPLSGSELRPASASSAPSSRGSGGGGSTSSYSTYPPQYGNSSASRPDVSRRYDNRDYPHGARSSSGLSSYQGRDRDSISGGWIHRSSSSSSLSRSGSSNRYMDRSDSVSRGGESSREIRRTLPYSSADRNGDDRHRPSVSSTSQTRSSRYDQDGGDRETSDAPEFSSRLNVRVPPPPPPPPPPPNPKSSSASGVSSSSSFSAGLSRNRSHSIDSSSSRPLPTVPTAHRARPSMDQSSTDEEPPSKRRHGS